MWRLSGHKAISCLPASVTDTTEQVPSPGPAAEPASPSCDKGSSDAEDQARTAEPLRLHASTRRGSAFSILFSESSAAQTVEI